VAKTWAIAGVDLHLDLAGTRRRAALESALREAVATGRLAAGSRLPSTRALAADLGVARNTVADAYSQLVAEGWLSAQAGAGTRVAARATTEGAAEPRSTPAAGGRPLAYDLRPGTPDLSTFPRARWLAAARSALADAPDDALGYAHPQGLPQLRAALADYLARARGVRTGSEQIIVCAGFSHAFWLVCQTLRARGARRLALERYLGNATHATALASGLKLITLPVDGDGAVVDRLGGAEAALLTPAHQFPFGAGLAADRRAEIAHWAKATGATIIEDDYDGEFRYDRHPLGALQALAPEHTVYVGTASKTLAPGLRLAWIAAPAGLVDELLAVDGLVHRGVSALEQLTLAQFIRIGAYDRHIRRFRISYRRRRDRLLATLAAAAPAVRTSGVAAGMHALVRLPGAVEEADVIAAAARRGLALEGLGAYTHDAPGPVRALAIGYGTPPEHAYGAALARLTATLDETLPAG
jgi:GntR family transcriptional regulator/MocR family aminotransferase